MPIRNDPFSLYMPIKIGNFDIKVYVDENLFARGEECYSRPHSHYFYELRLNLHGKCEPIIEGEKFLQCENELLLIHPGESHYLTFEDGSDLMQYSIRFLPDDPKQSGNRNTKINREIENILSGIRLIKNPENSAVAIYFEKLNQEISERRPCYINVISQLLSLILTELLRLSGADLAIIFPNEDIKFRGISTTRLETFFTLNMTKDVRIRDLASCIMLSERQTSRVLQRFYGCTFSEKMNETRLNYATYLIKNTSLSISEISSEAGFGSSGTFSIQFKKKHGMSPSEYKARFTNNR